jgi:hypothetical protein
MHKTFLAIGCVAFVSIGCSQSNPIVPSPQISTPAPVPAPPTAFAFAQPFTELPVGATIHRQVKTFEENSECVDLAGWGCHYFRVTPPRNGQLVVLLTWLRESQPNQPLDLSITDSNGATAWADYGPGASGLLRIPVKADRTYQLTVWYTFRGVEFEIGTSLESN